MQWIVSCAMVDAGALCRRLLTIGAWFNKARFQGKRVEISEDITRLRLEFSFHSNILNYFTDPPDTDINSIQGYSPSPGVMDYSCTKVITPALASAKQYDMCLSHVISYYTAVCV